MTNKQIHKQYKALRAEVIKKINKAVADFGESVTLDPDVEINFLDYTYGKIQTVHGITPQGAIVTNRADMYALEDEANVDLDTLIQIMEDIAI